VRFDGSTARWATPERASGSCLRLIQIDDTYPSRGPTPRLDNREVSATFRY
jgi:hypothetical protein